MLQEWDSRFLLWLEPLEREALLAFRAGGAELDLLKFAFLLEEFLAVEFGLAPALAKLAEEWGELEKIYHVRRNFVQRQVYFKYREAAVPVSSFKFVSEGDFASRVLAGKAGVELDGLERYAAFALFSPEGRARHREGVLFKMPAAHSFEYKVRDGEVLPISSLPTSARRGFDFVGNMPGASAFWHAKYCIHCHKTGKDSCRKGDGAGNEGCPLGQKISEMAQAKAEGGVLAPLAIAMIDNPLILLTGERICNDCKLGCIFKKQEAVEVPALETAIMNEVLTLPFGFEVYYLLLRWNPLKREGYLPKQPGGRRILVCGAGVAGIAASYYFLQEGFRVTCIDGLQVLPLGFDVRDVIKDASRILERAHKGDAFGGVMEYGITPRWNKNLLVLMRIALERHEGFRLYGGVRFGSSITAQQAFGLGFSYIAFCMGSGKPVIPSFVPYVGREGIFTASDFLMQVNTTGRFRELEAPVVVLGGGLTALDAATEAKVLTKGEVFVVYRKQMGESPAFRQNDAELEFALREGVRYLEGKNPIRIQGKDLFFEDGTSLKFGTLIIAAGLEPLMAPEAQGALGASGALWALGNPAAFEALGFSESFGFFGDLSAEYRGSVVKAIASVKDKHQEVCRLLLASPAPEMQEADFESKVLFCGLEGGMLRLVASSPLQAVNSAKLDLFKLKLGGHSIPLTLFELRGSELTFFIKLKGEATREACGLKAGAAICLMRAKNDGVRPPFDLIITDDEDFITPLKHVCENVYLAGEVPQAMWGNALLYLTKGGALPFVKAENIYVFNFAEMNCMLGGVCSRCLRLEGGKQIYECTGNIRKLT